MKKLCKKCGEEKELELFNINNKNKSNGRSAYCSKCTSSYSRQHYKNNKETYQQKRKIYQSERNSWYFDFKRTLECEHCGENHESCLEFHHKDPTKKDFTIGQRVTNGNKELLIKEIKKCIVLCSNCHRKLHWEEKQKHLKL